MEVLELIDNTSQNRDDILFIGDTVNGRPGSFGAFELADNNFEIGYFNKGSLDGVGSQSIGKNIIISGFFYEGLALGLCLKQYENCSYFGYFNNGILAGNALKLSRNGDWLFSKFDDEKPTGNGIFYSAFLNKLFFVTFENCKLVSSMLINYETPISLNVSDFCFSKAHKNKIVNSTQYEKYVDGDYSHIYSPNNGGFSVFNWSNGVFHICETINKKRNGFGLSHWEDSPVYISEFKDQKKCGFTGEFNLKNRFAAIYLCKDNSIIRERPTFVMRPTSITISCGDSYTICIDENFDLKVENNVDNTTKTYYRSEKKEQSNESQIEEINHIITDDWEDL